MRNWKTTISGILTLLTVGNAIYQEPAKASDPNLIAIAAAGVGLILAKDANVSGPPPAK